MTPFFNPLREFFKGSTENVTCVNSAISTFILFLAVAWLFMFGPPILACDGTDLQRLLQLQLEPFDPFPYEPEAIVEQCTQELENNKKLTIAQNFHLHIRRGLMLGYLQKYEEAIADFNDALKHRPGDVHALYLRASSLGWLGKKDDAFKELIELVRLHPEFAKAHSNLANHYLGQGNYKKSIEFANKALALDGKDASTYYIRASSNFELNEFNKAITDLNQCIMLGSIQELTNLAYPYLDRSLINIDVLGNFSDGYKDIIMALQLDPGSIRARVYHWGYYFKLGKYKVANRISERQGEFFPGNPRILQCRTASLIAEDLLNEAYEMADQAVQSGGDDKNSMGYLARGQINFALGKYSESLKDYEKAHSNSKEVIAIIGAEAYFLASCPDEKLRQGTKALELASECARKTGMQSSRFLMLVAMAHAECGDFDKAVTLAKKSLEKVHAGFPWLEEYKKRLRLFEEKQPYRFIPTSKVFDYIY